MLNTYKIFSEKNNNQYIKKAIDEIAIRNWIYQHLNLSENWSYYRITNNNTLAEIDSIN